MKPVVECNTLRKRWTRSVCNIAEPCWSFFSVDALRDPCRSPLSRTLGLSMIGFSSFTVSIVQHAVPHVVIIGSVLAKAHVKTQGHDFVVDGVSLQQNVTQIRACVGQVSCVNIDDLHTALVKCFDGRPEDEVDILHDKRQESGVK